MILKKESKVKTGKPMRERNRFSIREHAKPMGRIGQQVSFIARIKMGIRPGFRANRYIIKMGICKKQLIETTKREQQSPVS